ncbi:hypothetical protein GM415_07710 [Pseudodesulfovibrio cashew]|uniref:Uncharacterized protein n=1 Tax=Pseudodesulfovibrio cashew TaxID=2678688 RepID=A0A6I6JB89_9BACT|nr:hypothetical protein [Pseudodesulfovibrio cashew]QGY40015.1 hypothetical protein GM415_07710 [Pseudodesulfovibrio cashew]
MANTERMKVLKAVRAAQNQVNELRADPSLAEDQVDALEKLFIILWTLEELIMAARDEEAIGGMTGAAAELKEVNEQLNKDIAELKQVAEAVDKAASVVNLLVDILGKAAQLAALV